MVIMMMKVTSLLNLLRTRDVSKNMQWTLRETFPLICDYLTGMCFFFYIWPTVRVSY